MDQYGQVIDVHVSKRRNIAAARKFFADALVAHGRPAEVTTDLAAPLLRVVDELFPDGVHDIKQQSNAPREACIDPIPSRQPPERALTSTRAGFSATFSTPPAPVAQGIERRFPKPCVVGSNPAGGTTKHQVRAYFEGNSTTRSKPPGRGEAAAAS